MIVDERDNQPVFIGRVGENNSRPVPFYIGDILEKYPDAVFSLMHKRYGDQAGYPVNNTFFDIEENLLIWRPQSGDLADEGIGELQIKASYNGDILKTKVYKTETKEALDDSADPPEPWESWTEQIEDAAAAAEAAAEDAGDSATAAAASAATAASAAATAAQQAVAGMIDDTSTGLDKVWSASKSNTLLSAITAMNTSGETKVTNVTGTSPYKNTDLEGKTISKLLNNNVAGILAISGKNICDFDPIDETITKNGKTVTVKSQADGSILVNGEYDLV